MSGLTVLVNQKSNKMSDKHSVLTVQGVFCICVEK